MIDSDSKPDASLRSESRHSTVANDIPIFPLSTVLFPGGVLPLRIFEARYMDMVKRCLRTESAFGVCLITDGREVGQPADHENMGCSARIAEWDMEQLGLLNIRTVGQRRFAIESRRVEKDGLIIATVNWVDQETDTPVPDEFTSCVELLRRIVHDLVDKEAEPMRRMVEAPYRFESASWVSNRLCEFLPISGSIKHKLMTLNDPLARMGVVCEYLQRQDVI